MQHGKIVKKRGYIPGTKIANINCLDFPNEILEEIIQVMVAKNSFVTIIKLCMVNRRFYHFITGNTRIWFPFIERWMRRPSIVRGIPNFKRTDWHLTQLNINLNQRFCLEFQLEACTFFKKMAVLQNSSCCGMCGASRHETICFWSLGMRVCKFCLRENLVSNRVLYSRYAILDIIVSVLSPKQNPCRFIH